MVDHRFTQMLCLVLLFSSVMAGDDPLENALKNDPDNTLFKTLLSSLKLKAEEEKTKGTFFMPSDRAIRAFLGEMGMTAEELLARPQLVDAIVGYHFVPGVTLKDFTIKSKDGQDLISTNDKEPSLLKTGDVDNDLEIFRSANTGQATLIDAQGNRVSVAASKPLEYGQLVFYDITNVLMSGQYFTNTRAAIKAFPEWTSFQELYQRASQTSKALADALAGRSAFTYLLPTNDALQPALQALSKAGASDLSQLLEYHVLPEMRAVPEGWKDGEKVKTLLAGHEIKAQLGQSPYTDPYDGSAKQAPELTLVPEVGKPAKATIVNIYAGKSILQGIDAPLVPNTAVAKALGAGDAAKTTTEKAAAAKPAENKASTGRRLLQRSGGAGGGSRNDRAGNWSAMNTQASIRAAATGRAPASYATAAGRRSAQQAGRRCVNCVAW